MHGGTFGPTHGHVFVWKSPNFVDELEEYKRLRDPRTSSDWKVLNPQNFQVFYLQPKRPCPTVGCLIKYKV